MSQRTIVFCRRELGQSGKDACRVDKFEKSNILPFRI